MFIATLAIAGIFPFAGFFSKDAILWETWSREGGAYRFLWYIGYATALMTAFYMFRLMYLTFYGQPRMSHEVEHHIHESPKSMTVPLVVLAICAHRRRMAGLAAQPRRLRPIHEISRAGLRQRSSVSFRKKDRSQPAARPAKEEEHNTSTEWLLMGLSLARAGLGWGMAWRSYRHADKGYTEPIAAVAPPVYNTLLNKYYVDEGYDYVFTGRRKLGDVRLGVLGLGEASCVVRYTCHRRRSQRRGLDHAPHRNNFQLVGQVDHRRHRRQRPRNSGAHAVVSRAPVRMGSGAVVRAGDDRGIGRFRFLLRVSLKNSS